MPPYPLPSHLTLSVLPSISAKIIFFPSPPLPFHLVSTSPPPMAMFGWLPTSLPRFGDAMKLKPPVCIVALPQSNGAIVFGCTIIKPRPPLATAAITLLPLTLPDKSPTYTIALCSHLPQCHPRHLCSSHLLGVSSRKTPNPIPRSRSRAP